MTIGAAGDSPASPAREWTHILRIAAKDTLKQHVNLNREIGSFAFPEFAPEPLHRPRYVVGPLKLVRQRACFSSPGEHPM
jgi:hypothetical protein